MRVHEKNTTEKLNRSYWNSRNTFIYFWQKKISWGNKYSLFGVRLVRTRVRYQSDNFLPTGGVGGSQARI